MRHHLNISLFAMMLAAGGLPLYIHLPQYAATELGLSLTSLGWVLIGIRVLDFVQDPLLGAMIDRWSDLNAVFAGLAAIGMGAGFLMLFTLEPAFHLVSWLTLALVVVFTFYSLGTILFYRQTVTLAGGADTGRMTKLAGFREAGTLAGVIIAAILPLALGYTGFGIALAVMALAVWFLSRALWAQPGTTGDKLKVSALRQSGGLWLLVLALVNALPVAVTSTLFLFFVSDKLLLPDLAGPFLILFFLAAGLSVPFWSRAVAKHSARAVLIPAMILAIASFVGAALLPAGAAMGFALICLGSGAALGADMVILPLLFSATLHRAGLEAGQAFGFWSLAGKLSFALAAIILLPLLDWAGFVPGQSNTPDALFTLTLAYAVVPCILKLAAIGMVFSLPERTVSI